MKIIIIKKISKIIMKISRNNNNNIMKEEIIEMKWNEIMKIMKMK